MKMLMKNLIVKIGTFLVLCTAVLTVNAQEIRVKSFQKLERDLFARTNPRLDLNEDPCTVIRFITPGKGLQFEGNVVGDPLYFAGETLVYMTAGSKRIVIKHPDYGVLRYDFPETLDKQSVYEVPLRLIESPDNRLRSLIMAGANISGFDVNPTPFVMIGLVKKWGGYIKVVSDLRMNADDAEIEIDNNGNSNGVPVWLSNPEAQFERTAVTLGGLYRPWKKLYVYAGLGRGRRNVVYEAANDKWAINKDRSFDGVEAECGAILHFKVFSMMVGVQTNQFKYVETTVGVGIKL